MPAENKEVAIVLKYTIRLSGNQSNFFKIRRDLINGLLERFNYANSQEVEGSAYALSVTYRFILDNFRTRFKLPGLSQAYLSNYFEREGSYIIGFTAVIITLITNYGSIRETADYFAEDIEKLFSIALDSQNVTYEIKANIQQDEITNINQVTLPTNSGAEEKSTLNKKLIGAYFLSFLSLFISLLFASQNFLKQDDEKSKSSDALDEYKVLKLISEEVRNQKIDEHLKIAADTVYIIKR